jgi:DNA polymerase-4
MFIAHFDIDAFYANVAIRDDPSLRGKPVAIAGSSRRAVVLTASYEARPFGVRSAMPLYRALEACPELVVVRPEMAKYKEVSREVFEIFGESGYPVEGLSLDEAFVEVEDDDENTESSASEAAERPKQFERAILFAQGVRERVFAKTGLTISAGVGTGKLIAKIASDACKPNGLRAVAPGDEAAFLAPLPVGQLWGVGPKTQHKLARLNISTIGDVAALDDAVLRTVFGSWGPEVRELARGIDRRRVEPDRETKSISTEETFEYNVGDERQLIELLREQARELAEKLERESYSASTVGIKIKRADFTTYGRQTHLAEPTRDARRIFRAAVYCLRRANLQGAPIRLLGTRVASLIQGETLQQSLFEGVSPEKTAENR